MRRRISNKVIKRFKEIEQMANKKELYSFDFPITHELENIQKKKGKTKKIQPFTLFKTCETLKVKLPTPSNIMHVC